MLASNMCSIVWMCREVVHASGSVACTFKNREQGRRVVVHPPGVVESNSLSVSISSKCLFF